MWVSEELVLQYIDGAGVVLRHDRTDTEILIPFGDPLGRALGGLQYFASVTTTHGRPESGSQSI